LLPLCCVPAVPRERRKAKYSTLQDTVEELSGRLGQLSTLEAANNDLSTRNTQLELVVKEQNTQLQAQKDTITRQAQQLQTQVCAQCMSIGVPGASSCILQEGLAVCVAFAGTHRVVKLLRLDQLQHGKDCCKQIGL
jgi:regulator of replication initiation timing